MKKKKRMRKKKEKVSILPQQNNNIKLNIFKWKLVVCQEKTKKTKVHREKEEVSRRISLLFFACGAYTNVLPFIGCSDSFLRYSCIA